MGKHKEEHAQGGPQTLWIPHAPPRALRVLAPGAEASLAARASTRRHRRVEGGPWRVERKVGEPRSSTQWKGTPSAPCAPVCHGVCRVLRVSPRAGAAPRSRETARRSVSSRARGEGGTRNEGNRVSPFTENEVLVKVVYARAGGQDRTGQEGRGYRSQCARKRWGLSLPGAHTHPSSRRGGTAVAVNVSSLVL